MEELAPCPACGAVPDPDDATLLPDDSPEAHTLGPAAGSPRLVHDCAGTQALQAALNPTTED